jgi:hypothetical protein
MAGGFIVPFSQGVALGYHILPLQGKCNHTARISRSLELNSQFGKLTDRTETPVPELAEWAALFCPQ